MDLQKNNRCGSLKESWQLWNAAILGDDINSIKNQIFTSIWDDGIFRVLRDCWQLEIEKNRDSPRINAPIYQFIHRSYFQNQVSAIRRLSDNHYPLSGKDGVLSLYSLIKDIESHRQEITRSYYFELLNAPYDLEVTKLKQSQFFSTLSEKRMQVVPKECDAQGCAELHEYFDKISQNHSCERNENDLISIRFFTALRDLIASHRKICKYGTKMIAHASIPQSRSEGKIDDTKISLANIWTAHKDLYKVVDFLSKFLAGTYLMPLPIANDNLFDFLEEPLVNDKDKDFIRSKFNEYRKETESWGLHNEVSDLIAR